MKHFAILKKKGGLVAQSAKHSAKSERARVRGSPGTPTCTLMAPGARKIHREYNGLHVPIQIKHLGLPEGGSHPLYGESKL